MRGGLCSIWRLWKEEYNAVGNKGGGGEIGGGMRGGEMRGEKMRENERER